MDIREEFEKLDEIKDKLEHLFFENGFYYRKYDDADQDEFFVNGAWYAFQEQQKKIDAVIDYIKNQERSDEYMTGIVDTDGLKELLK